MAVRPDLVSHLAGSLPLAAVSRDSICLVAFTLGFNRSGPGGLFLIGMHN